jgi:hypothetical protein
MVIEMAQRAVHFYQNISLRASLWYLDVAHDPLPWCASNLYKIILKSVINDKVKD